MVLGCHFSIASRVTKANIVIFPHNVCSTSSCGASGYMIISFSSYLDEHLDMFPKLGILPEDV